MGHSMGLSEAFAIWFRTQLKVFRLRRKIARLERERRRASLDYEDYIDFGTTQHAYEALERFNRAGFEIHQAYRRLNEITNKVPPEHRV